MTPEQRSIVERQIWAPCICTSDMTPEMIGHALNALLAAHDTLARLVPMLEAEGEKDNECAHQVAAERDALRAERDEEAECRFRTSALLEDALERLAKAQTERDRSADDSAIRGETIDALRAENERLQLDAARYRKLAGPIWSIHRLIPLVQLDATSGQGEG